MSCTIRVSVYPSKEDYERAYELGCSLHPHFSFDLPLVLIDKFKDIGKLTYFNLNEFVNHFNIPIDIFSVDMLEVELERERTAFRKVNESMEALSNRLELAKYYGRKQCLIDLGFKCVTNPSDYQGDVSKDYKFLITHSTRPPLISLMPVQKDFFREEEGSEDCLKLHWEGNLIELVPLSRAFTAVLGYGWSEEKAWRKAVDTWESLLINQRKEAFLP